MKSMRPKVLHPLAGRPILRHVIDSSLELAPAQIIVVVGHGADQVCAAMGDMAVTFVEQTEQLGTGHALRQCLDTITPGNDVLVLVGDAPLIRAETLAHLVSASGDAAVSVLSFLPGNNFGYGRIARDGDGQVRAIVEERDASPDEASIDECNSGILLIDGGQVFALVDAIGNDNAQCEYYLTDVVQIAVERGARVTAVICEDTDEVRGINNQQQLAVVESIYRRRVTDSLMAQGAKLYDPERLDIRGELQIGRDVEIDVNCIFEGKVSLGDNVCIGANCVIRDTSIGAGSKIKPMTVIEEASIGRDTLIGPFARIRPGSVLEDRVKIGNFVETKQVSLGAGSKVNHLSYIGDTEMGSNVNVGAGTITCNYDGANKHKTIIEDNVFIGSDTQLIAPVRIARNSTIGAGSTITKDTPADKLTLSRAKQTTLSGWVKPVKKNKEN